MCIRNCEAYNPYGKRILHFYQGVVVEPYMTFTIMIMWGKLAGARVCFMPIHETFSTISGLNRPD